jgi:hypothetical protein
MSNNLKLPKKGIANKTQKGYDKKGMYSKAKGVI